MKKVTKIMITVLLFVFIMGFNQAHALKLRLSYNDIPQITINDNDFGLDWDPNVGVMMYASSFGIFTTNMVAGVTKPVIGSSLTPKIDLVSLNVSSGGGVGKLTVELTETGFGELPHALTLMSLFGGTTDGVVNVATYVDTSNTEFGQGMELVGFEDLSGAFSRDGTRIIEHYDYFSMTIVSEIFHNSIGDSTTSFDVHVKPVPEPSTVMLLGSGLIGTAFYLRRRIKK